MHEGNVMLQKAACLFDNTKCQNAIVPLIRRVHRHRETSRMIRERQEGKVSHVVV